MVASPGRKRGRSTSTPSTPEVTPAPTVNVRASKPKPPKPPTTPLEKSAAGVVGQSADPAPDPELIIDNLLIRRARAWCRRRAGEKVWAQLVELSNLNALGVDEQPSRHVAMLTEGLYAAADQRARVHRCPRNGPKCALCRSEAYDDPDFGKEQNRQEQSAIEAYAARADEATEWRRRVFEMTGVRVGDDMDADAVWQLLNQVDYALQSYADACGA